MTILTRQEEKEWQKITKKKRPKWHVWVNQQWVKEHRPGFLSGPGGCRSTPRALCHGSVQRACCTLEMWAREKGWDMQGHYHHKIMVLTMIMIPPTISIHIHPCPKYTNKHWCIPMISKMYRNSQDQKIFRKSRRFQTSQARDALDWAPCGSAGLGAAPDGRGAQQPLACRAQHAAAPWSGGDAIGWRGAKEDVAWWTMGNPIVLAKGFYWNIMELLWMVKRNPGGWLKPHK